MSNNTLKNRMTRGETIFGWVYMIAMQFVMLPFVLLVEYFDIRISALGVNMIFFTLNLVLVVLFCHRFLVKNLRALGKNIGNTLAYSLAGFVIYWAMNIVVGLIIVLCFPDFTNANDAYIEAMSGDGFWLLFVGTVLLVPIVEETIFRGAVFGSLDRVNRPLAYVVSVLLFSAVHVVGYIGTEDFTLTTALVSLLQYIPPSICLAWVYTKTDTIFASTLVHAAVNFLGMMAMR